LIAVIMENQNDNIYKTVLLTRQLAAEYEDICWRYKLDLVPAGIEISEMKTYQGYWDAENRTIKISRQLIEKYTWDVTVNILKHEIAHQIVTEVFKIHDGHGKLYEKACDRIGVPYEFRSAAGDIPKVWKEIDQKKDPKNIKLLEKVEKLLSLAQSKNENEATLAMQKANEIIRKYNLTRDSECNPSEYTYVIINHKKKRIERYQKNICSVLSEFFFVNHVYSYLYDGVKLTTYKTIELIGTRENVMIAEHVYYFLVNELEFLWKDYKVITSSTQKNKNSYFLGVLKGFKEKLSQQERETRQEPGNNGESHETTSLQVLLKDAGLAKFMKQRFPRLHTMGRQTMRINTEAYSDGKKKGRKLTLHKAVTKSNGFLKRMLTSGRETE